MIRIGGRPRRGDGAHAGFAPQLRHPAGAEPGPPAPPREAATPAERSHPDSERAGGLPSAGAGCTGRTGATSRPAPPA